MPKKSSSTVQSNKPGKKSSRNSKSTVKTKFPIVALGASAGGLEAFECFFDHMPDNANMAFVLVSHQDPRRVSLLPELIQKHCSMKVEQIMHGTDVQVNHVYIIPPNRNLEINNGKLELSAITKLRGTNLPIDSFLCSLAKDQGKNAVAIILSGTGSDGSLGVRAIKAEKGMVMVQQEDTARYDGMPRSAIDTGMVDYILPVEEISQQLIKITSHAFAKTTTESAQFQGTLPEALKKIYAILHAHTGHDFSLYKSNTICRRIEKRMNIHQIESINDYVEYLQGSEREVNTLFKELLIGVTNFFRDADAFDFLKNRVLPELLQKKPDDYNVRVWVCGCSTGEEAYSMAIVLHEFMLENNALYNIQIFATDIDEEAISRAREGLYPENIKADVSPERLEKYFIREESGFYRVKKIIREMLVFAPQNVIKDPPFTKLDILCCRNVLIYLRRELQQKLLPRFHYSLKPNGILFLGSSETVGQASDLFSTPDKKWKLFRKNVSPQIYDPPLEFPVTAMNMEDKSMQMPRSVRDAEQTSALQLVETILQQSNTPACAIINDSNNVIYIHGHTGLFLEPAEGRISVNILEMARAGLKGALTTAIRKVSSSKEEVIMRDLKVEHENGPVFVDVTVKPILALPFMQGHLMVILDEKASPSIKHHVVAKDSPEGNKVHSAFELERELMHTRENLQSTIEELETSNEELKATNEELQSTNEELQSTNEEMETSKEELQSLNEESETVNAELQSRIDDLSKANDDMKNLLDSTHIATIFLDTELCIRRYTPTVVELVPLLPQDIGRPLNDFSTSLIDVDMSRASTRVLKDLSTINTEVHNKDGRVLNMTIRPYRKTNNAVDGVVITFEDVTKSKSVELAYKESEARYRMLFELSTDSVVLIDTNSAKFIDCNENAHTYLGYTREEFLKLKLSDIENKQASADLIQHFDEILKKGGDTFFTQYRTKDGQLKGTHVKLKVISIGGEKYFIGFWSHE